jgi:hypothetical protein
LRTKSQEIREFIIQEVDRGSTSVVRAASEQFGISRQAVNRYLRQLVAGGVATSEGKTKGLRYTLNFLANSGFTVGLVPNLSEHTVWQEKVRPLLDGVRENVLNICNYCFTEIFNNAIEHSEGTEIAGAVRRTAAAVQLIVVDNGVGIFTKIQRGLNLEDRRHAVLELSKGKITTDAHSHTGEGIFFASRACDRFSILSGGLLLDYAHENGSWSLDEMPDAGGTSVSMKISVLSGRVLSAVFAEYSSGADDYSFAKTHVPVSLSRYGDESLVSRSQAKRLLGRLDGFSEIMLDFAGVEVIGQAFADEIFRVFQLDHPGTQLRWTNATSAVENLIRRAKSHRTDGSAGG